MRERVFEVNRERLNRLNEVYRPKYIQSILNVSPQVWHNYRTGKHDVPESMVNRICEHFKIEKSDLALR